jgi:hypothetical protein
VPTNTGGTYASISIGRRGLDSGQASFPAPSIGIGGGSGGAPTGARNVANSLTLQPDGAGRGLYLGNVLPEVTAHELCKVNNHSLHTSTSQLSPLSSFHPSAQVLQSNQYATTIGYPC